MSSIYAEKTAAGSAPAMNPSSVLSGGPASPGPRPPSNTAGAKDGMSKDEIIADLRRQLNELNDSTSAEDVSSIDSRSSSGGGGRRRRRRGGRKPITVLLSSQQSSGPKLGKPPVLPRIAESKPVRLQLGLNLDVELELKARLQGDVALTLLQ